MTSCPTKTTTIPPPSITTTTTSLKWKNVSICKWLAAPHSLARTVHAFLDVDADVDVDVHVDVDVDVDVHVDVDVDDPDKGGGEAFQNLAGEDTRNEKWLKWTFGTLQKVPSKKSVIVISAFAWCVLLLKFVSFRGFSPFDPDLSGVIKIISLSGCQLLKCAPNLSIDSEEVIRRGQRGDAAVVVSVSTSSFYHNSSKSSKAQVSFSWKMCVKSLLQKRMKNLYFVFLLPQCDDQHHLLDYCKNVKNAFVVICQVTNLSLSLS